MSCEGHMYNPGKKNGIKVEISSKFGQDQICFSVIFGFYDQSLFLEERLGTMLSLHPILRFYQYFLVT